VAGTARILSVRAVLMILAVIVAVAALAGMLMPASSGQHGATLGAAQASTAKVSPHNIIWN